MDDYPYNLGPYTRKITTASPAAQLWFARGLNWCFGFHHEEAIHCFEAALATDPDCAMAHWGIAYAVGPNYNFPWEMRDPDTKTSSLARAYDATQAALALSDRVTAPERALIQALPARFPQRDPIEDQRPWNDAFADAMRRAHQAHRRDLDIRSVFVEAIMNRTPWQMWNLRTGAPAADAGTLEAQEVLDTAFRTVPGALHHPGLLHLHIHLMEMSRTPKRRCSRATGCASSPPTWATSCTCPATSISNAATTRTWCCGTRKQTSLTASITSAPVR